MANNKDKSITVETRKALSDAVSQKYGTIYITGELAGTIFEEMNKKWKPAVRGASGLSMLAGLLFWPLLLVGIVGSVISADEFAKYKVEPRKGSNTLVLTLKKK